jgi:hypothetical protein
MAVSRRVGFTHDKSSKEVVCVRAGAVGALAYGAYLSTEDSRRGGRSVGRTLHRFDAGLPELGIDVGVLVVHSSYAAMIQR